MKDPSKAYITYRSDPDEFGRVRFTLEWGFNGAWLREDFHARPEFVREWFAKIGKDVVECRNPTP